jgi:hypothetical protein
MYAHIVSHTHTHSMCNVGYSEGMHVALTRIYAHTYIHAYVHTSKHTHIHTVDVQRWLLRSYACCFDTHTPTYIQTNIRTHTQYMCNVGYSEGMHVALTRIYPHTYEYIHTDIHTYTHTHSICATLATRKVCMSL